MGVPILELIRLEESLWGTFGVLKINKRVFCVTLEPSDQENLPNRSSIPTQQYRCRLHKSPRFGTTYRVEGVPGRSQILFHPGNLISDTEGCILLAQHFGKIRGERGVLNSGATFRQFLAAVSGHDELHLTVREVY